MGSRATARRLPEWLKVKAPGSAGYLELRQLVRSEGLNTVCEEAHCPNIGECWGPGELLLSWYWGTSAHARVRTAR